MWWWDVAGIMHESYKANPFWIPPMYNDIYFHKVKNIVNVEHEPLCVSMATLQQGEVTQQGRSRSKRQIQKWHKFSMLWKGLLFKCLSYIS